MPNQTAIMTSPQNGNQHTDQYPISPGLELLLSSTANIVQTIVLPHIGYSVPLLKSVLIALRVGSIKKLLNLTRAKQLNKLRQRAVVDIIGSLDSAKAASPDVDRAVTPHTAPSFSVSFSVLVAPASVQRQLRHCQYCSVHHPADTCAIHITRLQQLHPKLHSGRPLLTNGLQYGEVSSFFSELKNSPPDVSCKASNSATIAARVTISTALTCFLPPDDTEFSALERGKTLWDAPLISRLAQLSL